MEWQAEELAGAVGFRLLDDELARDVECSLQDALANGVTCRDGSDPLSIFRESLVRCIRGIESSQGTLLQRFLKDGPYEKPGRIPKAMASSRLSDEETATAITFIYSHMVHSFQGCLAELLAVAPCVRLVQRLQDGGRIPIDARLYVGDAVSAKTSGLTGFAKGADMHILVVRREAGKIASALLAGVVEVKSYPCSQARVLRQIDRHMRRARTGLRIVDEVCATKHMRTGADGSYEPVRIAVVPASWRLPRTFRL